MAEYKYIIESIEKGTGRITLNRADKHNAINIEMIREIATSLESLNTNSSIRIIIIDAAGKNFSAGADLNWMKKGLEQNENELLVESKELAMLFYTIYSSPKATIVYARGKVIGGANGIVAAADIALATPETSFAFTELKLGLVPATIAPYIVRKTSTNIAREWMLTARNIEANEAYKRGLVNWLISEEEGEKTLQILCDQILNNGPEATEGLKQLFRDHNLNEDPFKLLDFTSRLIAKYRVSDEGQEGINAFFEKRKPGWKND